MDTWDIMGKLIPAIVVAAVSALTFIAYRHPNAYKKIFLPLAVVYLLLTCSGLAWNLSNYFLFNALFAHVETSKLEEAKSVARSCEVSVWFFILGFGSYCYLFFLTFLSRLLNEEKPEMK